MAIGASVTLKYMDEASRLYYYKLKKKKTVMQIVLTIMRAPRDICISLLRPCKSNQPSN